MLPKMTFVLGGAASGKSLWAEKLLLNSGLSPVYLATSRVYDTEMERRVDIHKARRDSGWRNFEADLTLGPVLASLGPHQAVLVDCATMWLTNHMMDDMDLIEAQTRLLDDLSRSPAPVVIVSNEVGHGIVPDNALSRQFREAQGQLNIALAEQANLAVMIIAGLHQVLKGTLP